MPPVNFVAWAREVVDTGAPLTCLNDCSSSTFGADTETRYVADLETPVTADVMVAWEVSLAEVAGKGTLVLVGADSEGISWDLFWAVRQPRSISTSRSRTRSTSIAWPSPFAIYARMKP